MDLRRFQTERAVRWAAAADGDDDDVIAARDAAAIARYGGEFLPGSYDDWAVEAREQLQRECVDLCALVCHARRPRGDLAGAVPPLGDGSRSSRWRRTGYRTLMEIQADIGDRAGAVSTYHHCASVLERELGVVPDQATATPSTTARAQQRGRRAAPGPCPGARAPRTWRRQSSSPVPVSWGSVSAWQTAAAGSPWVAIVNGGAGVGKSRLVSEWPGRRAAGGRRRRQPSVSGPRDAWRWPRSRTGFALRR